MAAPEIHHLFHEQIADHSFSADRQTLAVARDNNVELYNRSGNKLVLQDELKGHDKLVTGVDIAPNTGRIVTCSQGGPASNGCSRQLANKILLLVTCRSKCICLGTLSFRLEAYSCPAPDQSCGYIRTLVTL